MKKLSTYLFLILFSFQTSSLADDIDIESLFGVKILDNIQNYANVSDGKKFDYLPEIITFDNEFINIERNDEFDDYYVRTNLQYKIINITGKKFFISEIEEFNNECKASKLQTVNMLSKIFDIKQKEFLNSYWFDARRKALYDVTEVEYFNDDKKFNLAAYCGYLNVKDGLASIMFVSWVTNEYYLKHVDGRWKKIDKFDNEYIKIFASPSS